MVELVNDMKCQKYMTEEEAELVEEMKSSEASALRPIFLGRLINMDGLVKTEKHVKILARKSERKTPNARNGRDYNIAMDFKEVGHRHVN
jgi:hypothetical protein